jgi:hypothetical protein
MNSSNSEAAKFELQCKLHSFHRPQNATPTQLESGNSSFAAASSLRNPEVQEEMQWQELKVLLDPLIESTSSRSSRIARWSHYYRAIDILLRLIVVFTGLIVSVLSFLNASFNLVVLSYIIGCIALVVVSIGELRELFHFTKRTTVLRSCHYQLESYIRKLRALSISGQEIEEMLEEIDQISKKIDKIDAQAFDIDFTQNKRKPLQITWNSSNPSASAIANPAK